LVRVIVTAVPGSGKTTVLNMVKEKAPDVVVTNLGTVMFEIARERYNIASRDEMRKVIPVEEYRAIQVEAAERIGRMEGKVLVDTHALIKTPVGYYPGLPPLCSTRSSLTPSSFSISGPRTYWSGGGRTRTS
jgi:adenylate kinase